LDRAGISCWMDVGQMGGGDQLYGQIYKGVYGCQVFFYSNIIKTEMAQYFLKRYNLIMEFHIDTFNK